MSFYKKLFKRSPKEMSNLKNDYMTGFHHDFFHLWSRVNAWSDKKNNSLANAKVEWLWLNYSEVGKGLLRILAEHEAFLAAVVEFWTKNG